MDAVGTVRPSYLAQLVAGWITYDPNDRWDVGINRSLLFSSPRATQYGAGFEFGRILTTSPWLSAGYNFSGFNDRDLVAGDNVDEVGCSLIFTVAVTFDTNWPQIKPKFHAELDRFAEFLKVARIARGEIEGHTDSVGSETYNQKLPERRAESAKGYVISKGVDASRLSTKGFGESQPIADNSTPEGRAKNWRVLSKRTTEQR